MSDPLPVIGLLRQLVQKEITLGILRAEMIKFGTSDSQGVIIPGALAKQIDILEQDCSSLTHHLANEWEKPI